MDAAQIIGPGTSHGEMIGHAPVSNLASAQIIGEVRNYDAMIELIKATDAGMRADLPAHGRAL
jgi:hypothetical protein